jgi:signal transduction histidine kinase
MIRQPPSVRRQPAPSPKPQSSIEEQVVNLAAQLETLRTQVRQAQVVASMGTVAATIAHEVNNLLTPILAFADSALQSDDVALSRKALDVTVRNSRMLISMSGRLLELAAPKPQHKERTDVRLAVNDALSSLCRDVEKDGIKFSMKVEEGLCVLADPHQLRQILFNLFWNAREAMASTHSGRLTVTASREQGNQAARKQNAGRAIDNRKSTIDNSVLIEVRNSGPVIAPELLPNIFEPFQSSKPAMRDGKLRCNGLGLALVRDLVRENDGGIDVTSNEQTGTTFRISLPIAD